MKKTLILVAAMAALATSLSACGRMADLEPPTARKTERAKRDKLSEPMPDPATINLPSNQNPIDGGPNNPFGRAPR